MNYRYFEVLREIQHLATEAMIKDQDSSATTAFADITELINAARDGAAGVRALPLPGGPSLMSAKVIVHDEPAAEVGGDVHGLHGLHGLGPDSNPCKSVKSVDEAEPQRNEARQKRKIHWTAYQTKVDVAVMGKTEQNGKVYEVRVAKRGDLKTQDTYGQCKVNGKLVITCSFTGGAWMLKRILTAGMQALVNYKAKRNRDHRRNKAKRKAAANAAAGVKRAAAAKGVK